MSAQWKVLPFFEASVCVPATEGSGGDTLPAPIHHLGLVVGTTCATAGYVGDQNGNIFNTRTGSTVKAYPSSGKGTTMLLYEKKQRVLFSVGDEEVATAPGTFVPTLKFAVGLENGVVILMRGDFTRDRSISARVVYEGSEVVTSLGFRDDGTDISLYIATMTRLWICVPSAKEPATPIDFISCQPGLTLVSPQERNQEMAIADSQAVYFYGPEGRGPCFIIDGEKTSIHWFKGYLVVVSREPRAVTHDPIVDAVSLTDDNPAGTTLTIYDLKGKYIAFRDEFGKRVFSPRAAKAVGEPIKHVLSDSGELIVATANNNVFRLREIDLTRKLDILYSKNLYTLAMSIVLQPASLVYNISKSKSVEDLVAAALDNPDNVARATVMDVCKRHADYLYSKQEYDASVKQYVRTIGTLQPSYVIRKFLDAQRIHNLAFYLRSLHNRGLANANHTTLLLNCYTKLDDLDSLNYFIDTSDAFDIDTAIQALGIASKFEQHDWYVKIQIEDLELYDEAISYFVDLPADLFRKSLKKYGQVLVQHRPQRMTKMLLDQ
ncbi:Vacuolar protein sorting-associated protein 11, partial [Kappamyces sp. JEL0680]